MALPRPAAHGPDDGGLRGALDAGGLRDAITQVGQELRALRAEVQAMGARQATQRDALRASVGAAVREEMLNSLRQLEAFFGIESYLRHGDHLPDMHGWPVSPDFALYLIDLLAERDYDLVIEFGSGTSTVLIARALERVAAHRGRTVPAHQVAFEHLETYRAQTLRLLARAGVAERVQLLWAPLVPSVGLEGHSTPFYACRTALQHLSERMRRGREKRILVVVDGPPAPTGRHARYPALPIVLAHLPQATIDVVLDDYARDDEKQVAARWTAELEASGIAHECSARALEKGACRIAVTPTKRERDEQGSD